MTHINEFGFFVSELSQSIHYEAQYYAPLPGTILEFLMQFQTTCVVDCCGIDAFNFSLPDPHDLRWAPLHMLEQLLAQEIEKAGAFPAKVLTIRELNQLLPKEDFVDLLQYLLTGLEGIKEKQKRD